MEAKFKQIIQEYNTDLAVTVVSPKQNFTYIKGQPLDAVWQVASVSKHISGSCLYYLANKHNRDWNDLLNEYVPYINATVKECLTHTSGLPAEAGSQTVGFGYSKEYVYETLDKYPVNGKQTLYQYNNMVFTLGFEHAVKQLGYTIDSAFGTFFADVGMDNSYIADYKDFSVKPYVNTTQFQPAGGVAASIRDLRRYLKLVLKGTFKELYTPLVAQENNAYYGVANVLKEFLGNDVTYHVGALMKGVSSIVFCDLHNQIGIVITMNTYNGVAEALALYVYYLLLGRTEFEAETVYKQNSQLVSTAFAAMRSCGFRPTPLNKTIKKGKYKSATQGKLVITDKVKVGLLAPVEYRLVDGWLLFVIKDIDEIPIQGYIKGDWYCSNRIHTIIDCVYCEYTLY